MKQKKIDSIFHYNKRVTYIVRNATQHTNTQSWLLSTLLSFPFPLLVTASLMVSFTLSIIPPVARVRSTLTPSSMMRTIIACTILVALRCPTTRNTMDSRSISRFVVRRRRIVPLLVFIR